MPELFRPISTEQLAKWIFDELDTKDSVLGIPRPHWFVPHPEQAYRSSVFGQPLDTPFGPAAGPHTQMAQNIVAAWLCGARYIELKTVQTLDVLDVSKPCIDMEDEGYNVEWSQELRIPESVDEYLRAWVLIHALHHALGFPGERPNVVFNLSVGYDLAGLQQDNMQWFLDRMQDGGELLDAVVAQVAKSFPDVRRLDIPARISDNVTLSTMHGCPPDEIGRIAAYLIEERGLHTLVKCNPTLLGPQSVRGILNDELGFRDVVVPDIAFEHDLKFDDAVPMLAGLRDKAQACGREFGIKLTNTLEVENHRDTFDAKEKMMYLSGAPLHALSINVAEKLDTAFDGTLPMSFSAGATCFNAPQLLASGMRTVTTCSDLLKTGGYLRLLDYVEHTQSAMHGLGATSIDAYILGVAGTTDDVRDAARSNLRRYAAAARRDGRNQPNKYVTGRSKSARELGLFDCVQAPCVNECPLDQDVPQYLRAVHDEDDVRARQVVLQDNPLPCILGRACDHLCEQACVRVHLDQPVAIRDIKRYIMDQPPVAAALPTAATPGLRVAVIGAGPGGLAAATELATAGAAVEVFEQHDYPGGMTSGAVPAYRLPRDVVNRDFARLDQLGVPVHFGQRLGRDIQLARLQQDGFSHIAIMVGAQLGKPLPLDGMDCDGVIDALDFLRRTREGGQAAIGRRIGVIGAGDTAMDCARVAWRFPDTDVSLIYRRTIDQMPADHEEIEQLTEEGIRVLELAKPQALTIEDGRLRGLVCRRMAYSGERDASGRKIPHEVPGEDFAIELDTLIIAIGQNAALECIDGARLAVNDWGFIKADPETFETSVPGIYAGGDVVNDGPATIVKAAAAGKAIARSILGSARKPAHQAVQPPADVPALLRRRGHRVERTQAPATAVAERHNFDEVTLTYAAGDARQEAARCLDCDRWCSICVSVCPNLAMQTYQAATDGRQPNQVLVLADLCNECGNCATFCPTAGRPYRDKPRLFGHRDDFDGEPHNAFFLHGGGASLEARWHGQTYRLDEGDGSDTSQEPFATMHALLQGLRSSVPHLPGLQPDKE